MMKSTAQLLLTSILLTQVVSDVLVPSSIVPRQLSQTHSEPDSSVEPHTLAKTYVERSVTWAEPRIKVIPPPAPTRSMLMAMHTEYTR